MTPIGDSRRLQADKVVAALDAEGAAADPEFGDRLVARLAAVQLTLTTTEAYAANASFLTRQTAFLAAVHAALDAKTATGTTILQKIASLQAPE